MSPVPSIRQQLVDAIEARLESITAGKVFNLPSGPFVCQSTIKGVYPWRKKDFSKSEVPAIKFTDEDARISDEAPAGQHERRLRVRVEIHEAGSSSASVVRELLADVIAAIGSDPKWGGLAFWTDLDGDAVDVEQAGDTIAAAQLQISIKYRTPLWRS